MSVLNINLRRGVRTVHAAIAIFQGAYIYYPPLHEAPWALPTVRWCTFPLIAVSGLWLARRHRICVLTRRV